MSPALPLKQTDRLGLSDIRKGGVNAYQIILKKRSGKILTKNEIDFLVSGYTKGEISDYQFSAFLMAVYFQGMSFDETTALTDAMMRSGKVFNLSKIPGKKIDKHSTGGVGDKATPREVKTERRAK
jgi:pyrimidine-nucleoside phosphorylase